jgi:predicted TIM-barrel fold metal-dependent hydrolase
MVTDLAAFCGAWPAHPVQGRLRDVVDSLTQVGVDRIALSPLDAVWCRNPHVYNAALIETCSVDDRLLPVPVIDPGIVTWEAELETASEAGVRLIRLFPNYHGYSLSDADPLLQRMSEGGLCVIVQTRMEDPRTQHPLSVVDDVSADEIGATTLRHPSLRVVIGGARVGELRKLNERIKDAEHLYADVSQADNADVLKVLIDDGLGERLVFGSHAPLFNAHAAMMRVVTDVEDDEAETILSRNVEALLRQ